MLPGLCRLRLAPTACDTCGGDPAKRVATDPASAGPRAVELPLDLIRAALVTAWVAKIRSLVSKE